MDAAAGMVNNIFLIIFFSFKKYSFFLFLSLSLSLSEADSEQSRSRCGSGRSAFAGAWVGAGLDAGIGVPVRAGHTTINLGVLWARPRPTEADEWAEVGKVHVE